MQTQDLIQMSNNIAVELGSDWPLVSVIVPVFNGEKHIESCLRSIVQQDYPALEVIVIDDGSTDRTEVIVRTFGDAVIYLRQANSGSAVARNHGVDKACGDYIAFNDSDDVWAPNRLKQQVKFLQSQSQYHAVCGRFILVPDDFELEDIEEEKPHRAAELNEDWSGWMYLRLLENSLFHIDTVLIRKSILDKVRFNPDYRRGQDYDFWLQLSNVTQIARFGNLHAFYRQNPSSISNKPHARNYRAEIIDSALARYGLKDQLGREMSLNRINAVRAQIWFEYGYELFRARWFRKAIHAFRACLVFDKHNWKSYKLLVLSYLRWSQDRTPKHVVGR